MTSGILQRELLKTQDAAKARTVLNSGAPFVATITSVNPRTETMEVEHVGGPQTIRQLHPFLGRDVWHRVGTAPGQQVLLAMRHDSKSPEATSYYQSMGRQDSGEERVQRYENGLDAYRPLAIGEQELASSGVAQAFFGRRPVLDVRGGAIRSWWDQDKLEHGTRAPTHVRQLHLNTAGEIGDEERFGVVSRPAMGTSGKSKWKSKYIDAPAGAAAAANSAQSVSSATDAAAGGTAPSQAELLAGTSSFAKEKLYVIRAATGPQGTIVDHREGHVIDDEGQPVQGKTGKNLRLQKKYFGGVSQTPFMIQVDEDGNAYIELPDTATEGVNIQVPMGKIKFKSGTASVEGILDGVAGTMELTASQTAKIKGVTEAKLDGGTVKIGQTDTATHPAMRTLAYKEADRTQINGLSLAETAEATIGQTIGTMSGALSGVFSAVMAAPLTPGVIVSLMGIAQNMLPLMFHSLVPLVKQGRNGLQNGFTGSYDSMFNEQIKFST